MSREIKFRVWDKINNCFLHDFFIDGDGDVYVESPAFDDYYTEMTMLNGSELSVMRSTGLKDKNGVEIYEGDILSYYLGSDYYIGAVKYDTDRFVIDWFRCSNILNRSCKNIYKRSKVIGNIYENHELLEE